MPPKVGTSMSLGPQCQRWDLNVEDLNVCMRITMGGSEKALCEYYALCLFIVLVAGVKRPFKNQIQSKSGHFEGWFLNGPD